MFAKANEVDAQFIGQNRLFDHIPQDLVHRFWLAIRAKADIAKSIQSKFYAGHDPAFPIGAVTINFACRKGKPQALHSICAKHI